ERRVVVTGVLVVALVVVLGPAVDLGVLGDVRGHGLAVGQRERQQAVGERGHRAERLASVRHAVAVGVGIDRVRTEPGLLGVGQPVVVGVLASVRAAIAVGVPAAGVRPLALLVGVVDAIAIAVLVAIADPVAVGVGAGGIGVRGELRAVDDAVAVGVALRGGDVMTTLPAVGHAVAV